MDFYPNGGIASMPGCEGETVAIYCSHVRAVVSFYINITGCLRFFIVIRFVLELLSRKHLLRRWISCSKMWVNGGFCGKSK